MAKKADVEISYKGGAKTTHRDVPVDQAREIEREFEWNPDVQILTVKEK